jgi:hypothetical protein
VRRARETRAACSSVCVQPRLCRHTMPKPLQRVSKASKPAPIADAAKADERSGGRRLEPVVVELAIHGHDVFPWELAIDPAKHPSVNVGDMLFLAVEPLRPLPTDCEANLATEEFDRLQHQNRIVLRVGGATTIKGPGGVSLASRTAELFRLAPRQKVAMWAGERSDAAISLLEVSSKGTYLPRGIMWRLSRLFNTMCVHESEVVPVAGLRFTVKSVLSQRQLKVKSGLVTQNTRIVFRNRSAHLLILIQASREAWDFDSEGRLRLDVMLSFLHSLLRRWDRLGCEHRLTMAVFSRSHVDVDPEVIEAITAFRRAVAKVTAQGPHVESVIHELLSSGSDPAALKSLLEALSSQNHSDSGLAKAVRASKCSQARGHLEQALKSLSSTQLFEDWSQWGLYDSVLNGSQSVVLGSNGLPQNDHFLLVHDGPAPELGWSSLFQPVRHVLNVYPVTVGWGIPALWKAFHAHQKRGHKPSYSFTGQCTPTLASQGNLLEATNVALDLCAGANRGRSLETTGHHLVIVSSGNGVFQVSQATTSVSKQRMLDSGIGCDLVCCSTPPLHNVPLFVFEQRSTAAATVLANLDSSGASLLSKGSHGKLNVDSATAPGSPAARAPADGEDDTLEEGGIEEAEEQAKLEEAAIHAKRAIVFGFDRYSLPHWLNASFYRPDDDPDALFDVEGVSSTSKLPGPLALHHGSLSHNWASWWKASTRVGLDHTSEHVISEGTKLRGRATRKQPPSTTPSAPSRHISSRFQGLSGDNLSIKAESLLVMHWGRKSTRPWRVWRGKPIALRSSRNSGLTLLSSSPVSRSAVEMSLRWLELPSSESLYAVSAPRLSIDAHVVPRPLYSRLLFETLQTHLIKGHDSLVAKVKSILNRPVPDTDTDTDNNSREPLDLWTIACCLEEKPCETVVSVATPYAPAVDRASWVEWSSHGGEHTILIGTSALDTGLVDQERPANAVSFRKPSDAVQPQTGKLASVVPASRLEGRGELLMIGGPASPDLRPKNPGSLSSGNLMSTESPIASPRRRTESLRPASGPSNQPTVLLVTPDGESVRISTHEWCTSPSYWGRESQTMPRNKSSAWSFELKDRDESTVPHRKMLVLYKPPGSSFPNLRVPVLTFQPTPGLAEGTSTSAKRRLAGFSGSFLDLAHVSREKKASSTLTLDSTLSVDETGSQVAMRLFLGHTSLGIVNQSSGCGQSAFEFGLPWLRYGCLPSLGWSPTLSGAFECRFFDEGVASSSARAARNLGLPAFFGPVMSERPGFATLGMLVSLPLWASKGYDPTKPNSLRGGAEGGGELLSDLARSARAIAHSDTLHRWSLGHTVTSVRTKSSSREHLGLLNPASIFEKRKAVARPPTLSTIGMSSLQLPISTVRRLIGLGVSDAASDVRNPHTGIALKRFAKESPSPSFTFASLDEANHFVGRTPGTMTGEAGLLDSLPPFSLGTAQTDSKPLSTVGGGNPMTALMVVMETESRRSPLPPGFLGGERVAALRGPPKSALVSASKTLPSLGKRQRVVLLHSSSKGDPIAAEPPDDGRRPSISSQTQPLGVVFEHAPPAQVMDSPKESEHHDEEEEEEDKRELGAAKHSWRLPARNRRRSLQANMLANHSLSDKCTDSDPPKSPLRTLLAGTLATSLPTPSHPVPDPSQEKDSVGASTPVTVRDESELLFQEVSQGGGEDEDGGQIVQHSPQRGLLHDAVHTPRDITQTPPFPATPGSTSTPGDAVFGRAVGIPGQVTRFSAEAELRAVPRRDNIATDAEDSSESAFVLGSLPPEKPPMDDSGSLPAASSKPIPLPARPPHPPASIVTSGSLPHPSVLLTDVHVQSHFPSRGRSGTYSSEIPSTPLMAAMHQPTPQQQAELAPISIPQVQLDDSTNTRKPTTDGSTAKPGAVSAHYTTNLLTAVGFNPFRKRLDRDWVITANRRRWSHIYPTSHLPASVLLKGSTQSSEQSNPGMLAHKGVLAVSMYGAAGLGSALESAPLVATAPNWTSLLEPATLPLTTDYIPSALELESDYWFGFHGVTLPPQSDSAWFLATVEEAIAQRLNNSFQVVITADDDVAKALVQKAKGGIGVFGGAAGTQLAISSAEGEVPLVMSPDDSGAIRRQISIDRGGSGSKGPRASPLAAYILEKTRPQQVVHPSQEVSKRPAFAEGPVPVASAEPKNLTGQSILSILGLQDSAAAALKRAPPAANRRSTASVAIWLSAGRVIQHIEIQPNNSLLMIRHYRLRVGGRGEAPRHFGGVSDPAPPPVEEAPVARTRPVLRTSMSVPHDLDGVSVTARQISIKQRVLEPTVDPHVAAAAKSVDGANSDKFEHSEQDYWFTLVDSKLGSSCTSLRRFGQLALAHDLQPNDPDPSQTTQVFAGIKDLNWNHLDRLLVGDESELIEGVGYDRIHVALLPAAPDPKEPWPWRLPSRFTCLVAKRDGRRRSSNLSDVENLEMLVTPEEIAHLEERSMPRKAGDDSSSSSSTAHGNPLGRASSSHSSGPSLVQQEMDAAAAADSLGSTNPLRLSRPSLSDAPRLASSESLLPRALSASPEYALHSSRAQMGDRILSSRSRTTTKHSIPEPVADMDDTEDTFAPVDIGLSWWGARAWPVPSSVAVSEPVLSSRTDSDRIMNLLRQVRSSLSSDPSVMKVAVATHGFAPELSIPRRSATHAALIPPATDVASTVSVLSVIEADLAPPRSPAAAMPPSATPPGFLAPRIVTDAPAHPRGASLEALASTMAAGAARRTHTVVWQGQAGPASSPADDDNDVGSFTVQVAAPWELQSRGWLSLRISRVFDRRYAFEVVARWLSTSPHAVSDVLSGIERRAVRERLVPVRIPSYARLPMLPPLVEAGAIRSPTSPLDCRLEPEGFSPSSGLTDLPWLPPGMVPIQSHPHSQTLRHQGKMLAAQSILQSLASSARGTASLSSTASRGGDGASLPPFVAPARLPLSTVCTSAPWWLDRASGSIGPALRVFEEGLTIRFAFVGDRFWAGAGQNSPPEHSGPVIEFSCMNREHASQAVRCALALPSNPDWISACGSDWYRQYLSGAAPPSRAVTSAELAPHVRILRADQDTTAGVSARALKLLTTSNAPSPALPPGALVVRASSLGAVVVAGNAGVIPASCGDHRHDAMMELVEFATAVSASVEALEHVLDSLPFPEDDKVTPVT